MARIIPVVLDLETFWSPTHSLTKMSPIEYVMHPETEIISCAAKVDGRETFVGFGEDTVTRKLRNFDWSDKLVIAHNNEGFDSMILAWRCGVRPKMWGCTLAMARPIHAKTAGGSLAALVEHYGIGKKDQTALINTKGRHLKDFTEQEIADMAKYNKTDVDQCWELFKRLLPLTSKDEMKLIDQTIRMLVEPQFVVDRDLLTRTLKDEQERKQKMLLDLATMLGCYHTGMGADEAAEEVSKILGSAPKFGQLLKDLGVTVPTKISPRTGKTAPALAKTDAEFLALQEHEDPTVVAACQARLGVKSTLLESRITAFLQASEAAGGKLPIPLRYCGADTTGRWSGTQYNPQNLPRVSGKPSDALRNCMLAGPGNKIVVADLSGIELRVNMFLWKVPYAMELFARDPEADLYKPLASEVLQVPIEGMPKSIRQAGKAMHLGCGFGLGNEDKYIAVAKAMAGIVVAKGEGAEHIAGYRRKHPEVVNGWRTCHSALQDIFLGRDCKIDPWGLCHTSREGIRLPSGRLVRYPDLRQEPNDKGRQEWVYGVGRHKARIYAGKVDENVVQALARDIIASNALEVRRQTGRTPALMVHDELVYVVPEAEAEHHLAVVQGIMRTPPVWWPELVVWSAGDIADTYGAAK